jgi:hypothetical protein
LNLSDDYGVSGVFKIGRPGYIFIDGDEAAVRESVKSIKERVRYGCALMNRDWQYLTISLQEVYSLNIRHEVRPSMVKVETMTEIWDYMRKHQVEAFFSKALYKTSLLD